MSEEVASPDGSALSAGLGPERAEFEEVLFQYTGRSVAYHAMAKTVGIDFAWVAFIEGRRKARQLADEKDIDALCVDDFPPNAEAKPLSERLRSAAGRCVRYNADVALLCEYAQTAADRLAENERSERDRTMRRAEFFRA